MNFHDILVDFGEYKSPMPKTAGIYYWKNNVTGEGYIGQSINLQKRMYGYRKISPQQRKLYDAFRQYGVINFTCYKVMDCCPSKVALNYWETYWIKELDTFGANGYNLTTGGDSFTASVETRARMSKVRTGKKFTDSHKNNISKALKGKPNIWTGRILTEEHRKNISLALKGRKFSEKHKKAISIARTTKYQKVKQ